MVLFVLSEEHVYCKHPIDDTDQPQPSAPSIGNFADAVDDTDESVEHVNKVKELQLEIRRLKFQVQHFL